MTLLRLAACSLLALLVAACASYEPNSRIGDVNATLIERIGTTLPTEFAAAPAPISGPFSPDDAAFAALQHNPLLQATLEDLNVATAQEVQAGLLINPAFSGEILFTGGGTRPVLDFGIAFELGTLLTRSRRIKAAVAERQQMEAATVQAIVRAMAEARSVAVDLWARQQSIAILKDINIARASAASAAQILADAGNLVAGELARLKRLSIESELALGRAELMRIKELEALSNKTGVLVDGAAAVALAAGVPAGTWDEEVFIEIAIEKSLALAAERERIRALGIHVGLADVSVWLDHLEVEAALEREDETLAGFGATFSLPLFDAGGARVGAARAALQAAELRYLAIAFSVANRARAVLRLLSVTEQAAAELAPQLVAQAGGEFDFQARQMNAMQIGPLRLIDARVSQLENALMSIEVARIAWLSHIEAEALLAGVGITVFDGMELPVASGHTSGEAH